VTTIDECDKSNEILRSQQMIESRSTRFLRSLKKLNITSTNEIAKLIQRPCATQQSTTTKLGSKSVSNLPSLSASTASAMQLATTKQTNKLLETSNKQGDHHKAVKKTILNLSPLSISASSVSSSSAHSNSNVDGDGGGCGGGGGGSGGGGDSNSSRSSLMSDQMTNSSSNNNNNNSTTNQKNQQKILVTNLADEVGSAANSLGKPTNQSSSEFLFGSDVEAAANGAKKLETNCKFESLI
jgi:hypothetical protein